MPFAIAEIASLPNILTAHNFEAIFDIVSTDNNARDLCLLTEKYELVDTTLKLTMFENVNFVTAKFIQQYLNRNEVTIKLAMYSPSGERSPMTINVKGRLTDIGVSELDSGQVDKVVRYQLTFTDCKKWLSLS